jgi:hypothetical protein
MPPADEMMTRLRGVLDSQNVIDYLYPGIISKLADRDETVESVALVVLLTVSDYTKNLPVALAAAMNPITPALIEALTGGIS